jgi:uncharacterized protein YjbI with pentapeptide repeats
LSNANLSGANLSRANLSGTELWFTDLDGANLQGAILKGSKNLDEYLNMGDKKPTNLAGATMPDGSKHP